MSKVPSQNITDPVAGEEAKPEQIGTFRLDAMGVSGADLREAPRRRISPQAATLGVLVVVAAGALFAMRQLGIRPLSAIAEPVKISYQLDKKVTTDHKKLLADLTVSHVDHQVPADQVQKNPFVIPELEKRTTTTIVPPTAPQGPTPEEIRRQQIADALTKITVHSVLGGSVPVARINSGNVRVGDTVAEFFTVIAINGRSVDLQADEQVYTISIDDEINRGPVRKQPVRRK